MLLIFSCVAVSVISFSAVNLKQPRPGLSSSEARMELGRYFFYDKRLSGNGIKSCSSCHDQRYAFSDGYRTSLGAEGVPLRRNALPLFNLNALHYYTWADNRITDLQSQMMIPLFNQHPVEMGFILDGAALEIFLKEEKLYAQLLKTAFPEDSDPYSRNEIITCISDFMLQFQSRSSPYDGYLEGSASLTPQQKLGMQLFFSERLGCKTCHAGNDFTNAATADTAYFNTGIIYNTSPANPADSGLYEVTHNHNDIGKFRVPSLRNLSFTQPYMHDGSLHTLQEVIDHYQRLDCADELKPVSPRLKKFELTAVEKKSLIAFLFSLSDSNLTINKKFSNPFSVKP